MAPIGQSKPTSTNDTKPVTAIDDDVTWDDLSEKLEETQSSPAVPSPESAARTSGHPSPVIPPLSVRGTPLPQSHPLPPAPSITPFTYGPTYDAFGRPLPTHTQLLEAQLMHLAEVELGMLKAVHILESHLTDFPSNGNPSDHKLIQVDVTVNNGMFHPLGLSHQGIRQANRVVFYGNERQNYSCMIKDMGYLLGLRRAIKILNDAVADTDRENIKYDFKVFTPPPPPPPPQPQPQPQPMMAPQNLPPQFFHGPHYPQMSPEKQLRAVAKDIVKDTVREYKDTVLSPGVEEVQKEMIKLLRDVCRDALQHADKHH